MTPPMTTVASGRWISAPGVVESAMGMKPRPATRAVIRIGRKRTTAASLRGLVRFDAVLSEVLDGADPDQAVEHGHAEECDEADAGRDGERHASDEQGENTACRGHRHGRVDQEREPDRVERAVQEQEDQEHRHRHDDHQPFRGSLQVLELTAPPRAVEVGKLDVGVDRGLRLGDKARDIAPADIDAHDCAMLRVFALDLAGTFLVR